MTYRRAMTLITGAIAAAMALFHMWAIAVSPPEAVIFRGIHLLFSVTLVFLTLPLRGSRGGTNPGIEDWVALVIAAVPILYLFVTYEDLVNRIPMIDDPTLAQQILGWACVVTVLEATRRSIGWALPATALVFLAYAFFFTSLTPLVIIDQLFLTTDGIFGSTLGVSAGFVVIFVLFGSFMERSGTGKLFMDFALALTGRTTGGPGKVAVLSSSLFGTVSGSAVANVMVTGQVTIPLMLRTGFRPPFAAGVEAVASTGGQIMPPIMGAAAFVMAEYMGVAYLQVVKWAALPAVLYYAATFAAVHFEAKRVRLVGLAESEVPRLSTTLTTNGHLFIPILLILGGLFGGYSAPLAALVGTLSCFPVALLRAASRENVTLTSILGALLDGAKGTLGIAMACACAGIVIGIIGLTGVGITFTQFVVNVAQESLIIALILTMIAGIILGMGMPTTPAYIVMVSLLVPALIKLGVAEPAAHMFAFYFAILSAITPPVALAVFAAAGLARSELWSSGWAAVKIGAAGFIVPFMFVFEPALLLIGDWPSVLHASVTATAGCLLLAAGLHGYLFGQTSLWQRVALVAAALCLIKPGLATDIAGVCLAGAVAATQLAARRREATAG